MNNLHTDNSDPNRLLNRPSHIYQHAFDMCAVTLNRTESADPVLLASSPFYARELLKRMGGRRTTLIPTGSWRLKSPGMENWLGPEVNQSGFQLNPHPVNASRFILWAEPERMDGRQLLRLTRKILLSDGQICVLVSGCLGRLLPEWRERANKPARGPLGVLRVTSWLHQAGFEIIASYQLRSISSYLLGLRAACWNFLGRNDLGDRDNYSIRNSLASPSPSTPWIALSILLARINSRND